MVAICKIGNMLAIYLDTMSIKYMLAIYYAVIVARENRTPLGTGPLWQDSDLVFTDEVGPI